MQNKFVSFLVFIVALSFANAGFFSAPALAAAAVTATTATTATNSAGGQAAHPAEIKADPKFENRPAPANENQAEKKADAKLDEVGDPIHAEAAKPGGADAVGPAAGTNKAVENSVASLAKDPRGVVVAYFSGEKRAQFGEKIKPLFEKQTSGCKACQIIDLTPYDDKGDFKLAGLEESLKQLPANVKILFFNFNMKKGEVPAGVVDLLTKYSAGGTLIVASAGAPKENQSSGPLSKTLFGQVKDVFIIGELSERDRLMPQSFFGPEMLTALRPPREFQGQGFGPLLFTSKLATNYHRRSPNEWTGYMKAKKLKSRKIWAELEDFFN